MKPSFAFISKGLHANSETRGLVFGHKGHVDLIIFVVIVQQQQLSRGFVKKHLYFSKYYEIYDYLKIKFSPKMQFSQKGFPIFFFAFNFLKYEKKN